MGKPTLQEWLQERFDNTQRIAATKPKGWDRDGWLEDGEYFAQTLQLQTALSESQERVKELELDLEQSAIAMNAENDRHIARIIELESELKLQQQMLAAIKHTVVATIGGVDNEGHPTSEINYLQRLRILLEKEREIERLREAIQKAPHAWTCEALTFNCHEDCTCWKREALAPTPKPTIGHYHSASGHRLPCALTDPHACYCEVGESDPPRTEAGE